MLSLFDSIRPTMMRSADRSGSFSTEVRRAFFMEHVAFELMESMAALMGDVLDAEPTECGKYEQKG